jgi:threonine/homoserine/homoserine lactone efflux protein
MIELVWSKFAAFVWFAWVGSVTPGPNNALALATAANFGLRAVLPLTAGVALGIASILLAVGAGADNLLRSVPGLAMGLKVFGVLYLLWLGLQLVRSSGLSDARVARAPRWFETAALQYANPKVWMLALGTVSAYRGLAQPAWLEQIVIALVFASCCVASNLIWGWAGASLRSWLAIGDRLRGFNLLLGSSLMATAAWLWTSPG